MVLVGQNFKLKEFQRRFANELQPGRPLPFRSGVVLALRLLHEI